MNLQEIEDRVAQLDLAEGPELIYSLLGAYGLPKASISRLRSGTYNRSTVAGVTLWKGKVFDRYVDDGGEDLHALIDDSANDERIQRERPRFVIARNAARLLAVDMTTKDTLDISLAELGANAAFFLPWSGIEKTQLETVNYADIKAAERMARLYDEIVRCNDVETAEEVHNLNIFFTRLLFCFFAEDTGVFPEGIFTNGLASLTAADGSDTARYLDALFDVLDTPQDTRHSVPTHFTAFGYVNGRLFSTRASAPTFSRNARQLVIDSGSLDWSVINPDIFGSMMQAVVKPGQRENLGMHYTSVENIMKVIRPLFLDDLQDAFDAATSKSKLTKLHKRISAIKCFDPACGSGNFLVIAYKELRKLEHRILKRLQEVDPRAPIALFMDSKIKLENFYGIEIDDFAHEVAILSLWLAKHQMNVEFRELFGHEVRLIPLRDTGNVVCANAARVQWPTICRARPGDEVYLLGNPPYQGAKLQKPDKKLDFELYFGTPRYPRNLDYISLWFLKGADFVRQVGGTLGFVSTSSVCQGDHVALLWPLVLIDGVEICFAHQPFQWSNQAKGQAGVTCVIVGLSAEPQRLCPLYSDGGVRAVPHINAYLRPSARDTIVYGLTSPLSSDMPEIGQGSRPNDGGHLVLSPTEHDTLIATAPGVATFIKRYMGTKEFLNGVERYCLWIPDGSAAQASTLPGMSERFDRVREARLASGQSAQSVADFPFRFDFRVHRDGTAIIVPSVSSEKREYIPVGFLDGTTVISNLAYGIYGAEPWVFGLISSRMHNAWVRAVAGGLDSRIRYSAKLCYNAFPVPPLSAGIKQLVADRAFAVLEARERYSERSVADLYDPEKMPPDLREAHQFLDAAVDQLYRKRPFQSDDERLELLFDMYEAAVGGAEAQSEQVLELAADA
jgi:hypothetical protein